MVPSSSAAVPVAPGDPPVVLCQRSQKSSRLPRVRSGGDLLRFVQVARLCPSAKASFTSSSTLFQPILAASRASRHFLSSNSFLTLRRCISEQRGRHDPALSNNCARLCPRRKLGAGISRSSLFFQRLGCSTHKAATPSTGASFSPAAQADRSSPCTAASPLPPSPIGSAPNRRAAICLGVSQQCPEVIRVEGLFDYMVCGSWLSPRHRRSARSLSFTISTACAIVRAPFYLTSMSN